MDLLYRFVVFVMAILLMFISLLTAIYCLGFTGPEMLPDLVRLLYNRWEPGIIFLLLFITGSWMIYPFFVRERNTTVIDISELGEVDITVEALDNLVNTVALQQEGVLEIRNRMRATEDGLSISLTEKVNPGIPIPEITRNLQLLVKSYIEDTTGVTVKEVRVLVESIGEDKKEAAE